MIVALRRAWVPPLAQCPRARTQRAYARSPSRPAIPLCPWPPPLHLARASTPRTHERLRGRRLTSRPATRRSVRRCERVCAVPAGVHLQPFIVCCPATSHCTSITRTVRRAARSNVVCVRPTLTHGRSAHCWLPCLPTTGPSAPCDLIMIALVLARPSRRSASEALHAIVRTATQAARAARGRHFYRHRVLFLLLLPPPIQH